MSPDRLPAGCFGYEHLMAMAITAFVRCWPRLVGTPPRLLAVPSGAPARVLLPAGYSWASQRGSQIQLSASSVSSPNRRPWLLPEHGDHVWRLPHAPLCGCVSLRLWVRIRWASVRYIADGTNTHRGGSSAADRAGVASDDSRQGTQQRQPLHQAHAPALGNAPWALGAMGQAGDTGLLAPRS